MAQGAPRMAAVLLLMSLTGLPFIFCEQVPCPVNLTVKALNTNYSLHWAWVGKDSQPVSFTAQYIGKFRLSQSQIIWKTACEEKPTMSCDLNHLNLHYLGIYAFRVRATVNGHHSEWARVDFAPSINASVGPPTRVLLSPANNVLEVSFLEPQSISNTSMKEKIPSLHYRIQYWERHANHKRPQVAAVDGVNTVVVLADLKSWTWYCVSVQSRTTELNRESEFTDPVCVKTQGGFHWGKFIWIFGTSLVLVFLIVLGILLRRFYNKSCQPTSATQPVCLDKHWPPHQLLSSDRQSEQCDLLTVISPSWDQVQSRARPDWQSSSDGQDSGIYSTSSKTTSEQSPKLHNAEQVKEPDTCLTPNKHILDEGFVEGSRTEESSD